MPLRALATAPRLNAPARFGSPTWIDDPGRPIQILGVTDDRPRARSMKTQRVQPYRELSSDRMSFRLRMRRFHRTPIHLDFAMLMLSSPYTIEKIADWSERGPFRGRVNHAGSTDEGRSSRQTARGIRRWGRPRPAGGESRTTGHVRYSSTIRGIRWIDMRQSREVACLVRQVQTSVKRSRRADMRANRKCYRESQIAER